MDNPLAQSIIKVHARCYDTSHTEFIHLYYKSIILQINNSRCIINNLTEGKAENQK